MKTVRVHNEKKEEFDVPINELEFRVSVYGIVIKDDVILLSAQYDGYDFPGGGVELGERLEDGLVREVREETGIVVKPRELVYCTDSFFKHTLTPGKFHNILIYYVCEAVGGTLGDTTFDEIELQYAEAPEWVSLAKVPELKFYNSVDSVMVVERAKEIFKKS